MPEGSVRVEEETTNPFERARSLIMGGEDRARPARARLGRSPAATRWPSDPSTTPAARARPAGWFRRPWIYAFGGRYGGVLRAPGVESGCRKVAGDVGGRRCWFM